MAVDDLWYLSGKGPDKKRVRSERYGRGMQWRARWVDESGKSKTKLFKRKADAEAHVASVRTDQARGTYIDPRAGQVTFRAYAEQWMVNQVHRATTQVQVETNLRLHVFPYFGDRPLSSIRPTDVQAWVRRMTDDLAPATVEVVYRYGSSIFKAAAADRYIARTPCVNVKLPKKTPNQVDPLPTALVHHLLAAVPSRYRALVLVGAASGLRQGEVLGLEVDRVSFLRRGGPTLRVDQQLVYLAGAPPYLAPPKTASSHRTIPIGQVLHEALSSHLAEFPAHDVEVFDHTSGRPVPRTARLIFTKPDGTPIDRPWFGRMWRPARKAALAAYVEAATTPHERADAQAAADRFAGAGFHDLRHYYATLLIRHGASVKEVQARLGHANATETLNTYAHLWPDSDDRTRTAVDRVLGEGLDSADSAADTA